VEFRALESLFASHQYHQEFQFLVGHFNRIKQEEDIVELEAIYQQVIRRFENHIWLDKIPTPDEVSLYQKLFREMEQVIALLEEDKRYHFVVVIPIADNPNQLKNCLQSLYAQCMLYHYGGVTDGVFNKVDVIIADDSEVREIILENQSLSREYTSLGLRCEYFGLSEQSRILASLDDEQLKSVAMVTGVAGAQSVAHKGASSLRNLAYLRLAEVAEEIANPLFFFIDSDQEFLVKVNDNGTEKDIPAINYLYHFEHIFREKQVRFLTGKVVGDPSVSPTVMIANFLEDVIAFLQRIVLSDPQQECCFHENAREIETDAGYHDMAEMFGYYPVKKTYDYHCRLAGEHTLEDTLNAFSAELSGFFYGEHPTRVTYYHHDLVRDTLKPARTVYTGNFVFRPDSLEYFIPFAKLNLHMDGPVLGRILQYELGKEFVSANTPLLHKRIIEDSQDPEYCSETEQTLRQVDLSGEFERQFLGDVMLFSVDKLLEQHNLLNLWDRKSVAEAVNQTKSKMQGKYTRQQQDVIKSLTVLESLLRLTGVEARDGFPEDELELCGQRFLAFVANVKRNFSHDSDNYAFLHDEELLADKCELIITSIQQYGRDRENWRTLLQALHAGK
jgi:hypothetical protein